MRLVTYYSNQIILGFSWGKTYEKCKYITLELPLITIQLLLSSPTKTSFEIAVKWWKSIDRTSIKEDLISYYFPNNFSNISVENIDVEKIKFIYSKEHK